MQHDFDYIIIGSGFGGSVSALRLSEKGYKVLVIEKGKWYKSKDFAKTNMNLRKWLWIPPFRFFGILKLRIFKHIVSGSGVGVGGGSLMFANTLHIPKPTFYNTGSWSGLRNWELELEPHFQTVLKMLGATRNPRLFDGDIALKELAKEIGREDYFNHTNVSVFFGEEGETVGDPYFKGKGPDRSGCNFCGGCMTGCRYNAKNSLDKNYLYLAQKHGVKIMAKKEVYRVIPIDRNNGSSGYNIFFRSSTKWFKQKEVLTSKGVVFSGGVLGTINLLLKLKKKSLPLLSGKLGDEVRTNNETLISVSTLDKNKDLSKGVAIGSIIHTDPNSNLEVVRYSRGSAFWKPLHLPLATGKHTLARLGSVIVQVFKAPLSYFKVYLSNSWSRSTAVLLFMQSIESKIKFKLNLFGRLVSRRSSGVRPAINIPESVELTKKYSKIINGKATSFVLETIGAIPSTAHLLGGAIMGKDHTEGVIDKDNKVFGYNNMLIIDGSMISSNPGVNPALSITAIAERAMEQIPLKMDAIKITNINN